jgi:ferritin
MEGIIAMISEKVRQAFNEQIKNELESAYIYLAMAAYFRFAGLDGMAQWMRVQTREEVEHAVKFFDHIAEREGRVELQPLKPLKTEWSSPLEAFRDAYKHEQFITGKINDLVKLARQEGDEPAGILLQWFVKEQVEEEASTSRIVQMLERVGDSGPGLLMMDGQLGKRGSSE